MSKLDWFHDKVTQQIVEAMEREGTGWTKPWARIGAQRNAVSGHIYQGVNTLITGMTAASRGFTDPRWVTFNQAKKLGGHIGKGEKCTYVMVMKVDRQLDAESGEEKIRRFARAHKIWNVGQCEGLEIEPFEVEQPSPSAEPIPEVEDFLGRLGIVVNHGGDAAFYSPSHDFIQLPPLEWFRDTDSANAAGHYYSTKLHEFTHATGHGSRLGRLKSTRFGSTDYAFEELVAEIGACMACIQLGIAHEPRTDHAKYLNNWIARLKDDRNAIFRASAEAQKALGWMIQQQQTEQEEAA